MGSPIGVHPSAVGTSASFVSQILPDGQSPIGEGRAIQVLSHMKLSRWGSELRIGSWIIC